MAYATREDVIQLHSEQFLDRIADRDQDMGADNDAVTIALGFAASEIDSYLSARYVTPIAGVAPLMVKVANVEIAVYRLSNNGGILTEDIRRRYEDTIKWLQAIAAGKANIGVPAIDSGAKPPVVTNFVKPVAMFGRAVRG